MNDQNLIPFSERTESERREIARKGGKKSGEKRRENKKISDAMALIMSLPVVDDDMKTLLSLLGITDEEQNQAVSLAMAMKLKADSGDVMAAQYCADINSESVKRAELELKKEELKEKRRHNKAEEAAKMRELDIRERELESKQGMAENHADAYTENFLSLLQKNPGQGLGEDD